MPEQNITCPNCGTEFPLTTSLAAPLVEATRREFEQRLAAKDTEIAQREAAIKEREASLEAQLAARIAEARDKIAAEEAAKAKTAHDADLQAKQAEIAALNEALQQRNEKVAELQRAQTELARQRQELEDQKRELEVTVAERLRAEREKIEADAAHRARLALQDDLDAKTRALADANERLNTQRAKLQEAQAAQAELLKEKQALEDARAQMQLEIQQGIMAGLEAARAQARQETEQANSLRLAEAQQTIEGMKRQIEDLKRRAEQGSQQLQGEVQELQLEAMLTTHFPTDTITPVPKGEFGGDCIQTVCIPTGQRCGTILWESKRTKNWNQNWLDKLKDDQRTAKAEVAIIVTQALPGDLTTFSLIDGIWVTHWTCALPVAICLRQSLIELALTKQAREGQETKMEMVYAYLTGPRFRQRIQAIVEAFTTMQDDLARERRAILRQWAKREEQLERVLQATAGMYGDLQAIAGQSIAEIEALQLIENDIADPPDEP